MGAQKNIRGNPTIPPKASRMIVKESLPIKPASPPATPHASGTMEEHARIPRITPWAKFPEEAL